MPVPARNPPLLLSFERRFLLLVLSALPPQAVASQDPCRVCKSPLPNAVPALERSAAQLFKMGNSGGRDGIKKM